MVWVDYIFLAVLLVTAITGFVRGVRWESFAVCVWVLGLLVAVGWCSEFSVFLGQFTSRPVVKVAAAFVTLLLVTLTLGSVIGYLLGDGLARASWFGRLLGLLAGGIRGLIITLLVVLLAGLTSLPFEPWWREAQFIAPFQKIVLRLRGHMPVGLARYIHYE